VKKICVSESHWKFEREKTAVNRPFGGLVKNMKTSTVHSLPVSDDQKVPVGTTSNQHTHIKKSHNHTTSSLIITTNSAKTAGAATATAAGAASSSWFHFLPRYDER
jgi:hypothetical protein